MRGTITNVFVRIIVPLLCICLSRSGFATEDTHARPLSADDFRCHRCNVILLNIELLRADHVGLISSSGLTPNIDGFFRDGIIFRDASAPAGETFLSNTAVLTATPTHSIHIKAITIDNFEELGERERADIEDQLRELESVAEVLQRLGYHTVGINQGGRAGNHVYLDRGFNDFSQWSSDLLFEDMVSLLIDKLHEDGDSPLFVLFRPTFLHQHQYRQPTVPESLTAANVRIREYKYRTPNGANKRGVLLKRRRANGEEVEKETERSIYRAQLKYGDSELSRIFEMLEKEYVKNSIIVLYANHGSGLGDNGIFRHGTSYQSSIHVPVLIKHPRISHAIYVDDPVALFDLVPTVYKMLNIPSAKRPMVETYDRIITGESTAEPLLFGRNSWDEYVRYGDWKLIIEYDRIKSLFNLKTDSGEEHNLYRVNTDKARQLESLLLQYKHEYR